jgi:hypothetical protein
MAEDICVGMDTDLECSLFAAAADVGSSDAE